MGLLMGLLKDHSVILALASLLYRFLQVPLNRAFYAYQFITDSFCAQMAHKSHKFSLCEFDGNLKQDAVAELRLEYRNLT